MREVPKGGLIGKTVRFIRAVRALNIPVYAANAGFFMVLAVFPALLLLLSLLRFTSLEVERLGEMLSSMLPQALARGAEELILLTYDNSSASAVGVSAVTMLWSASRGVYGLITGLNRVYGVAEDRGYFHTRLISVGYTFALLPVLLLTLWLHIFGGRLVAALEGCGDPLLRLLLNAVDLRFFLLLGLQSGLFAAMFMALPNGRRRFREGLPGALLASAGWLIFSDLYSVYAEHFAHLSNVYGSVYAVALSMLWLYCCMAIVFYGGALNRFLSRR